MNNNVEWIILVTDRYQKSRSFYKDVLGFPVEREMTEEEFCQFRLANFFLAIYGRRFIEQLIGNQHVGTPGSAIYTMGESDDIDAQYRVLSQKGVPFIKEPTTQPWGQRTAYFTDPDGHIWELQQWIKKV